MFWPPYSSAEKKQAETPTAPHALHTNSPTMNVLCHMTIPELSCIHLVSRRTKTTPAEHLTSYNYYCNFLGVKIGNRQYKKRPRCVVRYLSTERHQASAAVILLKLLRSRKGRGKGTGGVEEASRRSGAGTKQSRRCQHLAG